jgi:alpha/beta hydrolase fold
MDTITVKDGTQIYFKDWGTGQPLFFHHGWPLSADDWDAQMMFFLDHGYRVIAHDRRGHGRSTQTINGHDMDTYAADVAELVQALDLKNAVHSQVDRPTLLKLQPTWEATPGWIGRGILEAYGRECEACWESQPSKPNIEGSRKAHALARAHWSNHQTDI